MQSVHVLRCYRNITRTRNVSEYMLVLAACLVNIIDTIQAGVIDYRVPLYEKMCLLCDASEKIRITQTGYFG